MPSRPSRHLHTISTEFGLIRSLARRYAHGDAGVVRGIGDDTAIVRTSAAEWSLITTDLLAEGVHFDLRTSSFADIGYRAAIANLSDIAAMGGAPRYLLVALAIPPSCSPHQIQQLYSGMMRAAAPYRVRLIGGDTSSSLHGLFVSITLTGTAKPGRAIQRRGARVGDMLYVTGTLGDSHAGLKLLTSHRLVGRRLPKADKRFLLARHHRPTARIAEGRWLAAHGLASAAIDLSDGLSGDLRHLCEESGVGAEISSASLPVSAACRAFADAAGLDAGSLSLAGGEDYELLFTVSSTKHRRFERLAADTAFRFTRIGVITAYRTGVRLRGPNGMTLALPNLSYEHFVRPS
jgi:thiamine-monophosphate kinase